MSGYKVVQLVSLMACLVSSGPVSAASVLKYSVKTDTVRHTQERDAKTGKPGKVVDKNSTERSEPKLTLDKDFVSVVANNSEIIFDFANKRVLTVNSESKTYKDEDMHARVYFRISELQNRSALGGLLGSAGVKMDAFDAFDDQSSLAVVVPGLPEKVKIEKVESSGTVTFKRNGLDVARYSLSDLVVSEPERSALRRIIANMLPLHPEIRKDLVTQKTFPRTLWLTCKNSIASDITYDCAKLSADGTPSDTLSKLGSYKVERDKELAEIFSALDKLGPNPKLPEKQVVVENARQALNAGNALDAALIVLEYGLMTGQRDLPEYKEILQSAAKDPQAAKFFSLIAPRSETEVKAAIQELKKMDRSKLSHGYFIDIMLANILWDSGDSTAIPIMKSVLASHPLIVGVYHDLGKMYLQGWRMDTGWECFRIANKLVPEHSQMTEIKELEKSLEADFPDFF